MFECPFCLHRCSTYTCMASHLLLFHTSDAVAGHTLRFTDETETRSKRLRCWCDQEIAIHFGSLSEGVTELADHLEYVGGLQVCLLTATFNPK